MSALNRAVEEGSKAVLAYLDENLRGRRCSLVGRAYPHELLIGFGPSKVENGLPSAEWMLFARDSSWQLETRTGLVAESRRTLSQRAVATVRSTLCGEAVRRISPRLSPVALTLAFSDASFLLQPEADRSSDVVWELRTPDDLVLRARADGSFSAAGADEPFEPQDEAAASRRASALATIRARPDEEAYRTLPAMRRVLLAAVKQLGWQVYKPLPASDSGVDLIMRTPSSVVLVQLTSHAGEQESLLHLERVAMRRGNAKSPVRPTTIDLPVVSERQLVEALADFAEAA